MTPAEKAFEAWFKETYPKNSHKDEPWLLSIFEAGWNAALSQQATLQSNHKESVTDKSVTTGRDDGKE